MNRFDIGLGSGVAFEFGHFNVSLDAQMGILELYDDVEAQNLNVSIGLGYRF